MRSSFFLLRTNFAHLYFLSVLIPGTVVLLVVLSISTRGRFSLHERLLDTSGNSRAHIPAGYLQVPSFSSRGLYNTYEGPAFPLLLLCWARRVFRRILVIVIPQSRSFLSIVSAARRCLSMLLSTDGEGPREARRCPFCGATDANTRRARWFVSSVGRAGQPAPAPAALVHTRSPAH